MLGKHIGDSRPFRPGCDPHFFFVLLCCGWPQKNNLHEFSDFWKMAMVDIVMEWGPLSISFEIYTINSFMKKKIGTNFITYRVLFSVEQPNKKNQNDFSSVFFFQFLSKNFCLQFFLQNFFFNFLIQFFKIFFIQNFVFNFFYNNIALLFLINWKKMKKMW